jgi:hypothetical protein
VQASLITIDVTPKVARADHHALIEFRVRPDLHMAKTVGQFDADVPYEINYFPMEEFAERSGWPEGSQDIVHAEQGVLRVTRYLEGEQEHVFEIRRCGGQEKVLVGACHLYSVADDLFTRRPYKGDLHIHSSRSDGLETPAHVAGACRRIGLDFMAVTDHYRYAPSLEAQRVFEGIPVDLQITAGEEVHPPENPVHIINFGGRYSINELFAAPRYRAEVSAIKSSLGQLPPGVDRYQAASCVWCYEEIRKAGGLGIFCHPYWVSELRYTPSGALTSYLFDRQPFDAFELLGGYYRFEVDSNTLQVARYHEERVKGKRIPIVGVSDAHGCERGELFGWYYTLAFSPTLALSDLKASIMDLYSVAVEALPGETVRAYGPFRLVKYALFLLREVLPQHDRLCQEEGEAMLKHVGGDAAAASMLAGFRGRTAALLERCWQAEQA